MDTPIITTLHEVQLVAEEKLNISLSMTVWPVHVLHVCATLSVAFIINIRISERLN